RYGERLLHHVGAVIADRARRQLDAVADDVVLDRLQSENLLVVIRIEREEFVWRCVRHRERVVGEVDLLVLLVPLVHPEIDDPADLEPAAVDQAEVGGAFVACRAGELAEFFWIATDEESSVTNLQSEPVANLIGSLDANSLRNRAGAAFLPFTPKYVSKPCLSL